MCTTKNNGETASSTTEVDWREETINGGSLKHVDLHKGSNGWASPPGNLFSLRSKQYLSKKTKSPASVDYLLKPTAVDWLRSTSKLEHVLSRADNRVMRVLRSRQADGSFLKSFVFAINLQVPGREHHNAVFYFSTDEPIQPGSLLDRFINGDDAFRNSRLKLVNRIVKGPWIVKTAVGNYSACLLGKALTCRYHRGPDYLEIDVDISSSKIAGAMVHLALGCVTSVTIDMGFVVEGQSEEELPEKLIGAVRICQMEMDSAEFVDSNTPLCNGVGVGRLGLAKVNHVDGEGSSSDQSPRVHS
ncbi:protein ENHANCED DISEASE RESISTANCE 2-like [Chenopodium quinoa]|uniref:protein ENHANCED DISEASE RESISTANCE 2-like n=1 Tax=Chenopodium quinoa TaxID=63459 RepID=UPI000B76BD16|nr:protein ENHANCED DISEASE RESISTANCE 2-like [Chenopodium quinoa]